MEVNIYCPYCKNLEVKDVEPGKEVLAYKDLCLKCKNQYWYDIEWASYVTTFKPLVAKDD